MNNTVFDRLVTASQSEGGKGLSDREIAGNLFIFFFAGVRVPPTTTSLHLLKIATSMKRPRTP